MELWILISDATGIVKKVYTSYAHASGAQLSGETLGKIAVYPKEVFDFSFEPGKCTLTVRCTHQLNLVGKSG